MNGEYRKCFLKYRSTRKPKRLEVTVLSQPTNNFDDAHNDRKVEIREVWVDNRMRLLSFHTDYRPAYWYVY